MMSFDPDFDPELIEYSVNFQQEGEIYAVDVYKIGGGTIGKAYDGLWGVRVCDGTSYECLLEATDLQTGTPRTHEEIPSIAVLFLVWEFDHGT